MAKKYMVNLTDEERDALEVLVKRARVSGLKRLRAQNLLKSDDGLTDGEIADELDVGVVTVERVRYEAFEPAEARRLVERFEIHHTPKHGSWLNVAEIFLSTLSIQCLDQHVPALVHHRRLACVTTADARIKLRRLYPSIP